MSNPVIPKKINTEEQLRAKLSNYNFTYNEEEFDRLLKLGFYHVFNSIVPSSQRKNGIPKTLSSVFEKYDLDCELRTILFPMQATIEGLLKQRFVDLVTEHLLNIGSIEPFQNNFIKNFIEVNNFFNARKLLGHTFTKHKSPIVKHIINNHNDFPIWAIMEIMSFGDFLSLSSYIKKDSETAFLQKYALKCDFIDKNRMQGLNGDTDYKGIFEFGNIINSMRNNVAHNQPIFDCRFKKESESNIRKISDILADLLNKIFCEQRIYDVDNVSIFSVNRDDFTFTNISDYLVLTYVFYVRLNKQTDRYGHSLLLFLKDYINDSKIVSSEVKQEVFGDALVLESKVSYLFKIYNTN